MRPEPAPIGRTVVLAVAIVLVVFVAALGGAIAARGSPEALFAIRAALPEARSAADSCATGRGDGMDGEHDFCGMGEDGMRALMGGPFSPDVSVISNDDAFRAADAYIANRNQSDLAYGDVLRFSNGYYIPIFQRSNQAPAFEMYVDRVSGRAHLELGPSMLWNTQYGTPAYRDGQGRSEERRGG